MVPLGVAVAFGVAVTLGVAVVLGVDVGGTVGVPHALTLNSVARANEGKALVTNLMP